MIADSAYFLGFLFTLCSISLALYNYSEAIEESMDIGKIIKIWDNVKVKDHAKEVLDTLKNE